MNGEDTIESFNNRAEEIRDLIKMNMPRSAAERTTILFDGLITDLIRKVEEGGQGGPIVDV
jgi:hypothetical protein